MVYIDNLINGRGEPNRAIRNVSAGPKYLYPVPYNPIRFTPTINKVINIHPVAVVSDQSTADAILLCITGGQRGLETEIQGMALIPGLESEIFRRAMSDTPPTC